MKTLEELAAMDHPYYCSEGDYSTKFKGNNRFSTMTKFLNSFEDECNRFICFRWDVKVNDDDYGYCASIFLVEQRQGIFYPCIIKHFKESEVERFLKYLKKHREVMNKFWCEL